jgi:hypothetical protein
MSQTSFVLVARADCGYPGAAGLSGVGGGNPTGSGLGHEFGVGQPVATTGVGAPVFSALSNGVIGGGGGVGVGGVEPFTE